MVYDARLSTVRLTARHPLKVSLEYAVPDEKIQKLYGISPRRFLVKNGLYIPHDLPTGVEAFDRIGERITKDALTKTIEDDPINQNDDRIYLQIQREMESEKWVATKDGFCVNGLNELEKNVVDLTKHLEEIFDKMNFSFLSRDVECGIWADKVSPVNHPQPY